MADDVKPATQGERLTALEERLTQLEGWGDEVQAWVDARAGTDDTLVSGAEDRLSTVENHLGLIMDHTFGVNVRPTGFHHSTRIPDPLDANTVADQPAAPVAPVASDDRVAALEDKLDRLLSALAQKG